MITKHNVLENGVFKQDSADVCASGLSSVLNIYYLSVIIIARLSCPVRVFRLWNMTDVMTVAFLCIQNWAVFIFTVIGLVDSK
jgi:hypothetical protein